MIRVPLWEKITTINGLLLLHDLAFPIPNIAFNNDIILDSTFIHSRPKSKHGTGTYNAAGQVDDII